MKKPLIIGITGGSGSGKTLFINQVVHHFSKDEISLVCQDNYYISRDRQPVDDRGIRNFDLPESFDMNKLILDVKELILGRKVTINEYTYNNPSLPRKEITVNPAPVIILEGIFIFYNQELRKLIDFSVFVHAMEHIMLSRRIIRDEEERGYDLNDVLYRYRQHVMPAFKKYILPYRDDCNIVVNNNQSFDGARAILSGFIRQVLNNPA